MDEMLAGPDATTPRGTADVGTRLRAAREAAGLDLAEIGARTRVPLRHLEAIERGDYAALPSPTYAVGFARAYARAVGLDEVATAADVRAALARLGPREREYEPYELPDPARVPSRGLAILAAGVALALIVLAGLWFGTDLLRGGASQGPAVVSSPVPPVTPTPAPTSAPTAAPVPTGGPVRLTADGRVWLRVYDGAGKTLFENTLNPGDHYDVPADARDPMLAVGRPDKLTVTLGGRALPPLGTGARAISDVKLDGAALAARLAGGPLTTVTPTPTATPTAAVERPRREASRPRAKPALTETQRANLEAAVRPSATGNTAP